MRIRPKRTARENASRLLPRVAQKYLAAGDKAMEAGRNHKQLHPFCNQTRKFLFTLEYFRACYGHSLDAHLKRIRDLQGIQEALDDCDSSRAIYLAANSRGAQKELLAALDQREEVLLGKLRTAWQALFEGQGTRRKFLRCLERPPRTVAAAASSRRRAPGRARQAAPVAVAVAEPVAQDAS